MSGKTRILESLSEQALLLPALVNRALTANDRVKYRMTLLQAAQAHAERPDIAASNLREERLAAGIEDETFDAVAAEAVKVGKGLYQIPEAANIVRDAFADVSEMLTPFVAAGHGTARQFSQRLEAFAEKGAPDRVLSADLIHTLTSADRAVGDSLHILVMDMHRALNALQADLAGEVIGGCRAYAIHPSDRQHIAAFMAGVNRTASLKFDHPGLSATATRVGSKLVLQNDIGTTDAHVLVIHVAHGTVTVTYTDVHLSRLMFFQSLFERFAVTWQDTISRKDEGMEDGVYHLSVGSHACRNSAQVREYLEHLGSRLVFLIDWNRARKRLRQLLPRKETIELLKWAADEDIGHMGWLKSGGEQLVFDAMAFAFGSQLRPGVRLDALLGERRALAFLKFVLKQALDGYRREPSSMLVADEVRAELASLLRSTEDALLDIALEHAGIVVELSDMVRLVLEAAQAGQKAEVALIAERAKTWETAADRELNRVRNTPHEDDDFMIRFMSAADDIADDLEEAVFHIALSPKVSVTVFSALGRLMETVASASRELVKAIAASRHARRGMPRDDVDDFLRAVHAICTMEHASDLAEREVKRALVAEDSRFADAFGCVEAARNLEESADGLMHAALLLRNRLMGRVVHAG